MSPFRPLAGAPCAVLVFVAVPVHAQNYPDSETVTVTANARAPVEQVPGGATVTRAEEFEDRLAISLRDALAFAPGVYSQPRFGQEIRISIRGSGISRGFHMRGLTLLQDGIPINLADDNGDFQELDPQVFENIEVYRGGSALRFGGSTLGGAINAVTPTGRSDPGYTMRVDGGSFGTLRTKASTGYADQIGDAFLAVTTDRSDGDRSHASRAAIRFNGNVGLRPSDTVVTRFYATVSHIDQDLPGTLTLAQARATPGLSLPANIVGDQERNITSIRLQNRTIFTIGNARLTIGGFYNAKQLFHPIFQIIDQKSADRGAFASVDVGGEIGTLPWSLVVGTQARFGNVAARQFVNVSGRRGAPTADARWRAQTVNSYGEARLTPLPGLTMVAGGVHSHAERDIANRLFPARNGDVRFDSFSPKFGLLWQVAPSVQFYSNYNRSIEFPGFSELSQTPATGVPGFTPVRPQRAWSFELGTRGVHKAVRWDVTWYRANLRGELLQFAVSPSIPASTFNANRTRHDGVEAGVDFTPTPWLKLRQVLQYNDFRFRRDAVYGDNRLPVVPKIQYRGELQLGTDAFRVTPGLEWQPNGAFADYMNTVRAPGYVLLNLGARARVGPAVDLFLDARNLTAKRAIGDISAVLAASPSTVAFYPVERRGFYGGIRTRF